jgi:RNA polymerase-binding transcription factor DksA
LHDIHHNAADCRQHQISDHESNPGTTKMPHHHDAVRAQLEEQLSRLLKRVGTIESDLKRSHDHDWNEQAIELENDEVLEGLDEMTQGEVRRIRAAISRIANGTYGVCSTCGHPISAERLAAIPGALTCVTCST